VFAVALAAPQARPPIGTTVNDQEQDPRRRGNEALATATEPPAEAWLGVSDELLWGFNHALSNRLAAISSVTKILEYSDTGADPLLDVLSEEIATLEGMLGLLRLLPRNPDGIAEPIRLEDILPQIIGLHRLRGDVRELEFPLETEADLPPVVAEPAVLSHALLLVLGPVSRFAQEGGAAGVMVRARGVPERAEVVFESLSDPDADRPLSRTDETELAAAERLLTTIGGSIGLSDEEKGRPRVGRIEVLLPTLQAIRTRLGE
jgi:hypothetical protein